MARSRYAWTEEKIDRFIAEGRGQGSGSEYRPWLTVRDVPSRGRSHRIYCEKTGRQVQLLSDFEARALRRFWWDTEVIDIREQFPILDRDYTRWIARRLGVKHPRDPKTGVDIVVTHDLLLTRMVRNEPELVAVAVKPPGWERDRRTKEKIDIERASAEQAGRKFYVYTPLQSSVLHQNLEWICSGSLADSRKIPADDYARVLATFPKLPSAYSVYLAAKIVDDTLDLTPGTAVNCLRRALYDRTIIADLRGCYIPKGPVGQLKVKSEKTFCEGLGIRIDEEDWPCRALSQVIMDDKGEPLSLIQGRRIDEDQKIVIKNAPSGRADVKGIVERYFGAVQLWVP